MRNILLLIAFFASTHIALCQQLQPKKNDGSNQIINYAGTIRQFQFFKLKDTLEITVTQFFRNSVWCYTEALPYALIIGTVNYNKNYPKVISALAICDNNVYQIGEKLKISQSYDGRIGTSPAPLNFAQDSLINGKRFLYIIGSEYPAVWVNVTR